MVMSADQPLKPALDLTLRRRYEQQLRAWFGEVRPLRLEGAGRFFTPPPALPMRAIFVPPALSASALSPSADEPRAADAADILQWLDRRPRLVVLGDPGSGKSTLVAWLSWRLAAGLTEPLPAWCDGVLPVPLVLRDLALVAAPGSASLRFEDLLQAWLTSPLVRSQPQLQPALGDALQQLLAGDGTGLLFMVDGLDELHGHLRVPVRDALRAAMQRWPQARFVITSRIVGYDDAPLDEPSTDPRTSRDLLTMDQPLRRLTKALDVQRLYVLPFDSGRIRQFAANWFALGEAVAQRGEALQQRFIDGLFRDAAALQLARIPNLLVMAAQVFGISNTLPDGRARLYEAITKAYLESIEQLYGLADARFSFLQKRSWLAVLGYRMQQRRSDVPTAADAADSRRLLVSEADVVDWLLQAMRDEPAGSDQAHDEAYVRGFVDAIARRSGLFVPRGDGLYAFSHLSIQEYFAALHLQTGMRELPVVDPATYQSLLRDLAVHARQSHWRETLITFFELPDWSPRMLPKLCDAVFGEALSRVPADVERQNPTTAPTNSTIVELLARLSTHPGLALSAAWRAQAADRVFDYLRSERGQLLKPVSKVLAAYAANAQGCHQLWQRLKRAPEALTGDATFFDLRGVQLVDWQPLHGFTDLRMLWLDNTNLPTLELVSDMTKLTTLWADNTPVDSIAPIAKLHHLTSLSLQGSAITDLAPISGLQALELLGLSETAITDLAPLASLQRLHALILNDLAIADLSPLANLHRLDTLFLGMAREPLDLTPLRKLPMLRDLTLYSSKVTNREVLDGMPDLKVIE